ncbi:hypothetical protein AGMMS49991_10830 [Spirochaetia bacterium]|nr:hypothetical protein AGMMS49991_10830 [Spirochaetia bacterium]
MGLYERNLGVFWRGLTYAKMVFLDNALCEKPKKVIKKVINFWGI